MMSKFITHPSVLTMEIRRQPSEIFQQTDFSSHLIDELFMATVFNICRSTVYHFPKNFEFELFCYIAWLPARLKPADTAWHRSILSDLIKNHFYAQCVIKNDQLRHRIPSNLSHSVSQLIKLRSIPKSKYVSRHRNDCSNYVPPGTSCFMLSSLICPLKSPVFLLLPQWMVRKYKWQQMRTQHVVIAMLVIILSLRVSYRERIFQGGNKFIMKAYTCTTTKIVTRNELLLEVKHGVTGIVSCPTVNQRSEGKVQQLI